MEICAITKTVLIDADGVYDPNDFNDRMLLGLKGTISEAELHFIRARMAGGRINKARRGEFKIRLPVGYVYDGAGRIVKDPSAEVREAVQMLFDSFRRIGTANGTAAFLREKGYQFPSDSTYGFAQGGILWKPLMESRVRSILHNPVYAGIYSYGKQRWEYTVGGKRLKSVPEDEWIVRLGDHHEGYISVDEFRGNVAKMRVNCSRMSGSAPREGSALLQGIAVCGLCGRKMLVKYYTRNDGSRIPHYSCGNGNWGRSDHEHQSVYGAALDKAVSDMLLETLTPLAISSAAEVERESHRREAASDNYFLMKVERANYELELAKKRYMSVDPSNRLVAFELERHWNEKIIELAQAEEELSRHNRAREGARLREPSLDALDGLAGDVREIWNSGSMRIQDKKRILRCLLEDVTITKGDGVATIGVLFKTGATRVIVCENARPSYAEWTTSPDVIEFIRASSSECSAQEIADMLNKKGDRTGKGMEFSVIKVRALMAYYGISTLEIQLRERGYLYTEEKASLLGISPYKLGTLRKNGLLDCEWKIVNNRSMYMYAPVQTGLAN